MAAREEKSLYKIDPSPRDLALLWKLSRRCVVINNTVMAMRGSDEIENLNSIRGMREAIDRIFDEDYLAFIPPTVIDSLLSLSRYTANKHNDHVFFTPKKFTPMTWKYKDISLSDGELTLSAPRDIRIPFQNDTDIVQGAVIKVAIKKMWRGMQGEPFKAELTIVNLSPQGRRYPLDVCFGISKSNAPKGYLADVIEDDKQSQMDDLIFDLQTLVNNEQS